MTLTPETFERERPRLFGLAYRMLGRPSEAEDVVQEAWLRMRSMDAPIDRPAALLTTLVSRLCIDRLRSAHVQRETYVGPWLPEPMHTSSDEARPDDALIRAESVSMAFLRILDSLGPMERAVFLLKEVFDYDHDAIGEALGVSVANSRQILRRARAHVAGDVSRYETDPAEQARVVQAFLEAAASGDPGAVIELLHPEIEWTSDGGGVRPSAMRPILGPDAVARFTVGIWRKARAGTRSSVERVNGAPAVVLRSDGAVDTVIGLDVRAGRIARVWSVRNPEKLRFLQAQLAGGRSTGG